MCTIVIHLSLATLSILAVEDAELIIGTNHLIFVFHQLW